MVAQSRACGSCGLALTVLLCLGMQRGRSTAPRFEIVSGIRLARADVVPPPAPADPSRTASVFFNSSAGRLAIRTLVSFPPETSDVIALYEAGAADDPSCTSDRDSMRRRGGVRDQRRIRDARALDDVRDDPNVDPLRINTAPRVSGVALRIRTIGLEARDGGGLVRAKNEGLGKLRSAHGRSRVR